MTKILEWLIKWVACEHFSYCMQLRKGKEGLLIATGRKLSCTGSLSRHTVACLSPLPKHKVGCLVCSINFRLFYP